MGKERTIDETGHTYGLLTVIKRASSSREGALWLCKCSCGNTKIVSGAALRRGQMKSCGCLRPPRDPSTRRWKSDSKLYTCWVNMRRRCYEEGHPSYPAYGGRGITICKEWRNSFDAFNDWALSHGYQEGKSIDRINNNKGYSPKNCRWATAKQQANNLRKNTYYTYQGETHTVAEWSDKLGIPRATLYRRVKYLPIELALTIPHTMGGYPLRKLRLNK